MTTVERVCTEMLMHGYFDDINRMKLEALGVSIESYDPYDDVMSLLGVPNIIENGDEFCRDWLYDMIPSYITDKGLNNLTVMRTMYSAVVEISKWVVENKSDIKELSNGDVMWVAHD